MIVLPAAAPLATLAPFVPANGPLPVPLATFTPNPVTTPRPAPSGIPHPRRTPILVTEPLS